MENGNYEPRYDLRDGGLEMIGEERRKDTPNMEE